MSSRLGVCCVTMHNKVEFNICFITEDERFWYLNKNLNYFLSFPICILKHALFCLSMVAFSCHLTLTYVVTMHNILFCLSMVADVCHLTLAYVLSPYITNVVLFILSIGPGWLNELGS